MPKSKCSSRQKESSCCTKRHNSFKSARRCPLVYSSFAVSDYNCCRRQFFAPADLKVAMVLSFNNTLSIALIWFVTCIGVFLNAAMMTHLFFRFSGNDVILEFHLSYAPDTPLRRIFRACGLAAAGVGVFCLFILWYL